MCRFLHPWAKRNCLSTLRRMVNARGLDFGRSACPTARSTPPHLLYTTVIEFRCKRKSMQGVLIDKQQLVGRRLRDQITSYAELDGDSEHFRRFPNVPMVAASGSLQLKCQVGPASRAGRECRSARGTYLTLQLR